MSLTRTLIDHVRAAFAGLWVLSHEHDEAAREIAEACRARGWRLAAWDVDRGLDLSRAPGAAPPPDDVGTDPLAAIRVARALASPEAATVVVMRNLHRFLGSPEVVQALDTALAAGRRDGLALVVLAPVAAIPVELERQFVVLEHDLPGREQLEAIARGVAVEAGELPEGEDLGRVLDAAGLTRLEAENAFSLSLIRHGRLRPDVLWDLKAQAVRKAGLLTLDRGGPGFNDLGGLDALKAFCARALRPGVPPAARARGVLLLGPPGSGKSALARALGREAGRPTLTLDVGALMGSLVGSTEANVRQALRTVDAMAPCVVMIDEIEKALAGVGSGAGDGGVAARLFGTLLTWMNDRDGDAFVVATANDIGRLPPELARAERFDGVFFLDLPSDRERAAIWRLYQERFGLDPDQRRPADRGWTGAEIKACCRLATLLDVPLIEAGRQIVPVSATAGEAIERLRSWAGGRCLAADRPGLYARPARPPETPSRSVRRIDPLAN